MGGGGEGGGKGGGKAGGKGGGKGRFGVRGEDGGTLNTNAWFERTVIGEERLPQNLIQRLLFYCTLCN